MTTPANDHTQVKPDTAIPSTERIFEAVKELRALEQIATRETVADLTGLKLTIVDDRLRALVDDGRLKRLMRGIYELVEIYPPPRPVFCGILQNQVVHLEIGDTVLILSPQEARNLAKGLGGFVEDARVIESGRQHLFLATELAAKVEKLERVVKGLLARTDGRQTVLSLDQG